MGNREWESESLLPDFIPNFCFRKIFLHSLLHSPTFLFL